MIRDGVEMYEEFTSSAPRIYEICCFQRLCKKKRVVHRPPHG
jgi:hypothetical protein